MPDLPARPTYEARAAEMLSSTLERQRRGLSADVQAGKEPEESDWKKHESELIAIYLLLLVGPWRSSYWGLAGREGVYESGGMIDERYGRWATEYAEREARRIVDGSRAIVKDGLDEIGEYRRALVKIRTGDFQPGEFPKISLPPASPNAAAAAELEARMNARSMLPDVSAIPRAVRYGVSAVTDAVSAGEFAVRDAFNASSGAMSRKLKLVAYWVTSRKHADRVCKICKPLDGQPESIWRAMFPSGPKAHEVCRCFLEWRVQ